MEEERRKAIRIKKLLVVLYSYSLDANKEIWDETQIRDISEEGIRITTIKSFQPNDTLTFLIKIPLSPFKWLEFNGRVVESEPLKTVYDESVAGTYLTRIEFVDLEEEQKELIRVYIAWFLSEERKEGGKK